MKETIDTKFTVEEIYEAYMTEHGGYLPCNKSVVSSFINDAPLAASSSDLKYVVNMLFDYVRAMQARPTRRVVRRVVRKLGKKFQIFTK